MNDGNVGADQVAKLNARIDKLEAVLRDENNDSTCCSLKAVQERVDALEKKILHQGEKGKATATMETGGLRYCNLPQVAPREIAEDVAPERARLILTLGKKWVNGTVLHYAFATNPGDAGPIEQMNLVRKGFEAWRKIGIGIRFEEVSSFSQAEIRIGFRQDGSSWSYVGRDSINPAHAPRTEPSMNFGWDLTQDRRHEGVAIHEIGHALGFEHEHQNPIAGIVWNRDEVLRGFRAPPNRWRDSVIEFNILRKLDPREANGSTWDPKSIMHYDFPASMVNAPSPYNVNGIHPPGDHLSDLDIQTALGFYPPISDSGNAQLKINEARELSLSAGQQANFSIIPEETRDYTIQTFGRSDTVIVLFENVGSDLQYVDGDDDSGTDLNAKIAVRLIAGRKYTLRVRLYSKITDGSTSVKLS